MFKFVAISNFYSLTFYLVDVKNFLKVFLKNFLTFGFSKMLFLSSFLKTFSILSSHLFFVKKFFHYFLNFSFLFSSDRSFCINYY